MIRVLFVAALTADGFIAAGPHEPTDWTSKEDKRRFAAITREAGVIVMGARTFATIGRALAGRRNIVYTHQVIGVDGVEITQEAPQELIKRLERDGHDAVAVIGGRDIFEQFSAAGVMDELYLTVEPVVFGSGVPLLQTATRQRLELVGVEELNANTVLLHYRGKPLALRAGAV